MCQTKGGSKEKPAQWKPDHATSEAVAGTVMETPPSGNQGRAVVE